MRYKSEIYCISFLLQIFANKWCSFRNVRDIANFHVASYQTSFGNQITCNKWTNYFTKSFQYFTKYRHNHGLSHMGRYNGRTNGRYQTYYLPCFAVDNYDHHCTALDKYMYDYEPAELLHNNVHYIDSYPIWNGLTFSFLGLWPQLFCLLRM